MKIEIIKCLQDNYSYLIIDKKSNEACVIDPSEADPVIDFCEENKIKIKYILNTHHHYDHVGGNKEIKEFYNSKILGFEHDKNRIPEIDILLKDQEVLKKYYLLVILCFHWGVGKYLKEHMLRCLIHLDYLKAFH